jgi:SAM-dependent methyltransferase
MSATDRLHSEQLFHDRQARVRAGHFAAAPDSYRFDDCAYLDHETWIRPAFAQLGDVRGLRVLDYGCGHGMAAVVLARRGALVTGMDLSAGYVEEASRRSHVNEVAVAWVHGDVERLPFGDAAFDRIWGSAILHHLDMARAGAEIRRVLKPGGRAVFCEPWGENALLNWARRTLPYPRKERTRDEEPLHRRDLAPLRQLFARVEIRGYQLLSMARRIVRWRRLAAGLDWCDSMLLARVPRLEQFCRYVVLTLDR